MNAQRLSTIANTIKEEYTTGRVENLFNQLVGEVEQAVNAPNEATQRSVETTLNLLLRALGNGPTNDFSPGLRDDLNELSVSGIPVAQLVGKGLAERLHSILGTGYLSLKPLDELRELSKVVVTLTAGLGHLNAGLLAVGVHGEELAPGDSIVGMTLPREEVKDVRDFRKEVAFLEHVVVALNRCVEGHATQPTVHSLRSSNFGIDFSVSLDVAAVFSLILTGLKLALDKMSKHRELKKNAEELGIDPKVVSQLGDQSKKATEESIDEIEADVFQHCKLDDNGDLAELKTAVRLRINGLANRIERGFIFEVRTALPDHPTEEQRKMGETVGSLSTLRFEPIKGPKLLELPETVEVFNDDSPETTEKPAKLRRKKPA